MKKILILVLLVSLPNITVANERFIPLELFTGGKIRSDTEIKFTPADLIFGEKKRKKIIGPQDWKNPFTKEIIKVYKRTKKNREGRIRKTQLFTVTNDGQCMGRVYDQRRSGTKYIKNGCKFPLGF